MVDSSVRFGYCGFVCCCYIVSCRVFEYAARSWMELLAGLVGWWVCRYALLVYSRYCHCWAIVRLFLFAPLWFPIDILYAVSITPLPQPPTRTADWYTQVSMVRRWYMASSASRVGVMRVRVAAVLCSAAGSFAAAAVAAAVAWRADRSSSAGAARRAAGRVVRGCTAGSPRRWSGSAKSGPAQHTIAAERSRHTQTDSRCVR